VEIDLVQTDVAQMIADLRQVIADSARRKGVQLSMIAAVDVPPRILIDGRHVRQILLNLLGNAVKFTSRGEVRLAIARAADYVSFEVTDTGMGIEPEALAEIFDAFTQTKAGAAAGGTGLGLAICQHLLRRMGTELHVESAPGAGSRFWFALPLVAADAAASPVDEAAWEPPLDARLAPGQQVTALVVDDSTVSRRILGSLLESAGLQVITATGALEGIDVATSHGPDVIFMDVKMPDLDGFSATRRLAADERTARIPVIAVTASALGDSRQAARDAGCVAYLPKPVRAQAVFAALQTHLGLVFISGEEPQPSAEALGEAVHDTRLAARLREAVAIGAVTDLEAIAAVLIRGSEAEAAVGQRLARLAANFDFEGVRELSASLEDAKEPHRVD